MSSPSDGTGPIEPDAPRPTEASVCAPSIGALDVGCTLDGALDGEGPTGREVQHVESADDVRARAVAAADAICRPGRRERLPLPTDDTPESRIERKIGYAFHDRSLLSRAMVHASIATSRLESNERLEFLGDAILGMVICDYLFRLYPNALEGELTKIKSNVVSRKTCAEIALSIGLDEGLLLGKGMGSRENLPQSLAAAAFEAVIGAMYLDGGLEIAAPFVLGHLGERIERAARLGHQHNFKSVLQQALQRSGSCNPAYVIVDERGPDHAKCFEIAVEVAGRRFPGCWGTSKKQAEQHAALAALLELGFASTTDDGDVVVRRIEPGEGIPPPKTDAGPAIDSTSTDAPTSLLAPPTDEELEPRVPSDEAA